MNFTQQEPDAKILQLNRIRDAAAMSPFLMRLLATRKNRYSIEACHLSRFRYRKHERVIALYELHIRDSHSQSLLRQWITGIVYADPERTSRLHRRLMESFEFSIWNEEQFACPPVAYIDEVDMLLQRFPFDRYLPTLTTLMSPGNAEALTMLCPQLRSDDNDNNKWHLEPMRYRPHLGATLRVTNRFDRTPTKQHQRMYLKVYRPEETETAYRFLRSTYERSLSQSIFSLVEPVSFNKKLNTVVLNEAPGIAFDALITSHRNVVGSAKRIGESLAAFHRDGSIPSRHRDAREFIQRAKRATKLLGWGDRDIGILASQLLTKATPSLTFTPKFATHLDIKPDHIIVDDDRITFIDMDSSAMSDPVADVATLLVRLDAMTTIDNIDPKIIELAKSSFLTSYRDCVSGEFISQDMEVRLPAHTALASLKVARFYMQHQVPMWRHHASRLLHAALNNIPREH